MDFLFNFLTSDNFIWVDDPGPPFIFQCRCPDEFILAVILRAARFAMYCAMLQQPFLVLVFWRWCGLKPV